VGAICSGRRSRATVQLYSENEAWELGLEADGEDVLMSVFRAGAEPDVAVHERRVTLAALRQALITALQEAPTPKAPAAVRSALGAAERTLIASWPPVKRLPLERTAASVTPKAVRGLGFSAEAQFRKQAAPGASVDAQLERADLHALLLRGTFRVAAHGRTVTLRNAQLFLLAERLLSLSEDVLQAWQTGRALFRRVEVSGVRVGVRRGPGDVPLHLTLGSAEDKSGQKSLTFPEITAAAFVEATARYARALHDGIVRHDPEQARNLRLGALAQSADALLERSNDDGGEAARTNPEPDTYRHFAPAARKSESRGPWSQGGRMRFVARWAATVPNIDLAATFLCGDRLLVGAARETVCLERRSGHLLWSVATPRAGSVVTPSGLARLHPDGRVMVHDLASGAVRFTTRLLPRAAGGACGAVVHAPGLPKLLVLAEGDRKITAIDLVSGDVRWRYSGRRPAAYRVRRAGKLLLVAGGDSTLSALDTSNGELVWRAHDRLPFTGDISVDQDSLFAIGAIPGGPAKLHKLDPWSGEVQWSAGIEDRPVVGQAPLLTPEVVVVPVRDRRGLGAVGFSRKDGKKLWQQAPGLLPATTAWLAVDDAIVANTAEGSLFCIEAADGTLRYNHVFSRQMVANQPRRLEPVLRSGALFVPQHRVVVVRPRDGEIIGTIGADLIPDLLRVDERCDVYMAEESGHLAAFGAAPRLTLVK